MNNKMVEMTLQQILELDFKAVELKKRTEETLQAREKELKKLFRKMEFDVMRATRKEAKDEYKQLIAEVEEIKEEMKQDNTQEILKLNKKLEENKEALVESIFEDLFILKEV